MGQSQNHSEKHQEITNDLQYKKLDDNLRDYSSYKGIRSETDSSHIRKRTNENTSSRSENNQNENSHDLVETVFTWNEGGSEVFVTGSFSNWKQWFALEKTGTIFRLKLLLLKEKHFFKFIVDKQWVCSSQFESVCDDKSNVNNFLDLSSKKEEKQKREAKNSSLADKAKKQRASSSGQNVGSFCQFKPDRSELNSESPVIPCSYQLEFNINNSSVQEQKGRNHYLNYFEDEIRKKHSNYSNCNESMKHIPPKPHVNM